MRKPNLAKWNNIDQLEGMLIFAQTLDELLFDFTLDSFKKPALNLHLSILEVRLLVSQLMQGGLRDSALVFSIEELEYHLQKDPVIPRPIPDAWKQCFDRIKDLKARPEKLFELIEALLIDVGKDYWGMLRAKIKTAVSDPYQKELIISLTKSFAAEVQLIGYNQRYAYFTNKRFFFKPHWNPNTIDSIDQVDDFFNRFEHNSRPRTIVFRGSSDFSLFQEYSEPFGVTIQNTPPPTENPGIRTQAFLGTSNDYPLYLILKEIEAKDEHYACERAKSQAEFLIDVCRFSNHKASLKLSSSSLIMEENSSYSDVIEFPPSPMKSNYGQQSKDVELSLMKQAIEILSGKHFGDNLRNRFAKVMEYHEAALAAKTIENQLLNLWSALEGFLPSPDQKTVRINHYLASLLPVLTVTYIPKIFGYVSDFLEDHSEDVKTFINNIEIDGDFIEKTIALLTCEEFEDQRTEICNLLLDNKLLLNRCFYCHKSFSNNKTIKKTVIAHKMKVSRHIRRIYTTRNLIVHSAQSLPYVNSLVENLHSYIDTLVNFIIRVGIEAEMPAHIGGILTLCSVHEKSLVKSWEGEIVNCNLSNYKALLFGGFPPYRF